MYATIFVLALIVIVALLLVHYNPAVGYAEAASGLEGFATTSSGRLPDGVRSAYAEGFASCGARSLPKQPATSGLEGFAVAAVDPIRMPACVGRSTDAQKLLARLAIYPVGHEGADEMRLMVSKLCCMEADIATPAAGTYRTLPLQYRTSHDMEPASTLVGRCMANAMRERDIVLITDKFTARGHALLQELLAGSCSDAIAEFDAVVAQTRLSMTHFCLRPQPSMDRPIGARDLGFWEPAETASLDSYKGISAAGP